MDILSVSVNNIIVDDVNFWKGDPETIIHINLWLAIIV